MTRIARLAILRPCKKKNSRNISSMSSPKPFLILQLRPEDETSDDEFRAFLEYGGLSEKDAQRVRMETEGVPSVALEDYAGVIVGGGPYNVSDDKDKKTEAQVRMEEGLKELLHRIIETDFPYLGMCYGLGMLGVVCGAPVSKEKYGEAPGAVEICITEEGTRDPLLAGLPPTFTAFCGHKESCQVVPSDAVLLASSEACPIQMIRVKKNVYAVQFHTELDQKGLEIRIDAYKHHGYFAPDEGEALKKQGRMHTVTVPMCILKRFVERYAK
jgi:GMP synthase (glutamine-hydrolysing)